VLLERRPSRGIWGGLWVFPEGPANGFKSFCRRRFSVEISAAQRMPLIEHGFTHFRLDIQPIRCTVQKKSLKKEKTEALWIELADAAGAAVPTPVKTLLAGLLHDQAL
jgi:A/G-specific adenine glycosylase